jgi:ribosomal protein S18 acetylase RimI-like enzyme
MIAAAIVGNVLKNVFWNCLTGPHARFAAGTGAARRYAAGLSPIAGFADEERPDFAALSPYCEPGEALYCSGWSGPVPEGWRVDLESIMVLMVWDAAGPVADDSADAAISELNASHAPQAVELAALTRPGPFGPRTIELGDYFGFFDAGRLVAMAGERMHAGAFHEISGICTHPDRQGRGLARRLTHRLVGRQLCRNETPFLHVMKNNVNARRLYERMGFRDYRETTVRVIARR